MRKFITLGALTCALLASTVSTVFADHRENGSYTNIVSTNCLADAQDAFLLAFQNWSTTNLTNGVEVGLQQGLDAFYPALQSCISTNTNLTNNPVEQIICQRLAEVAFWRAYLSNTNGINGTNGTNGTTNWEQQVEAGLHAYVRHLAACLTGDLQEDDDDDDGNGRPNHPGNGHGNGNGNNHPGNNHPGNNHPGNGNNHPGNNNNNNNNGNPSKTGAANRR